MVPSKAVEDEAVKTTEDAASGTHWSGGEESEGSASPWLGVQSHKYKKLDIAPEALMEDNPRMTYMDIYRKLVDSMRNNSCMAAHETYGHVSESSSHDKNSKRLALNRLAASRSRERKRLYVKELESCLLSLVREVVELRRERARREQQSQPPPTTSPAQPLLPTYSTMGEAPSTGLSSQIESNGSFTTQPVQYHSLHHVVPSHVSDDTSQSQQRKRPRDSSQQQQQFKAQVVPVPQMRNAFTNVGPPVVFSHQQVPSYFHTNHIPEQRLTQYVYHPHPQQVVTHISPQFQAAPGMEQQSMPPQPIYDMSSTGQGAQVYPTQQTQQHVLPAANHPSTSQKQ